MKGVAFVEAAIIVIVFFLLLWGIGATEIATIESTTLYYRYSAALLYFGIPIIILLVTKRRFEDYTYTPRNPDYNLEIGLNSMIAHAIPYGTLIFLTLVFSFSLFDLPVVIGLSIGYIVATILLFKHINQREACGSLATDKAPSAKQNIIVVIILLIIPIIMGIYFGGLTSQLISLVIWQLLVSGFGEEAFWRGYIQTRLNDDFRKPYKFMGVEFGWGLIVTSFLFALQHVLNPFNPFTGSFEINILWGVFTFFGGIFLGLIRERTGSLIATGLAHGLTDAVGEGIALVLGLTLS